METMISSGRLKKFLQTLRIETQLVCAFESRILPDRKTLHMLTIRANAAPSSECEPCIISDLSSIKLSGRARCNSICWAIWLFLEPLLAGPWRVKGSIGIASLSSAVPYTILDFTLLSVVETEKLNALIRIQSLGPVKVKAIARKLLRTEA